MKVNSLNSRDISFNGVLESKALKQGLVFAADNGTLFAATTTLVLSSLRPFAILSTPKTDKRNKQIACSKSVASSLNGYLIALACSRPLSNAIKKINKNPKKYLTTETISSLKDAEKTLTESKAYILATQLFKLGLGAIIAAPKAILTAYTTPYVVKLFENPKQDSENVIFKGKPDLAKRVGNILNKDLLKSFSNKYKDSNFPMHIIALTDTLSTGTFINQISKNKNLNQKDKKPLVYNTALSTILSISSTYLIDHFTKGSTDKFINKFEKANINDKNLPKYIEGIKIAKPIIIAGLIYYIAIPIISTFIADRINFDKKSNYSSKA